MGRTPVTSSNIKSIGYEPSTGTLEVEFKASTVYHYHLVPPEVHAALVVANSVGRYFNEHIKDQYLVEKVGG